MGMPKQSDHPKFRISKKAGPAGQVWVSYWYDMRGTGHGDIALGSDRDRALKLWERLNSGAAPASIRKPKSKRKRHTLTATPPRAVVGARRSFAHVGWSDAPAWAKPMYIAAERRSTSAGRSSFLTPAEFLSVVERAAGRCELTGIEFQTDPTGSGKRRPFAPSLDRIDCSLGYINRNVRIVCLIVNCALGDFGESAFLAVARAYVERFSGSETPACVSENAGATADVVQKAL